MSKHLSKGFTLIELMITLLLSLMITYAIAQVLMTSNRTSVTSDGMSQSQETGRFVMSYLGSYLKESGLGSTTSISRSTGAFISCTDFPNLVDNNACIEENGGGETQDSIRAPGIHGDRIAVSRVVNPAKLFDCTGSTGYRPTGAPATTPLTPYQAEDRIINTFWVDFDNTTNLSSLMCQGFLLAENQADVVGNSPAQAIANGVEAMHILYGEATEQLPPNKFRNVRRYVAAASDPAAPRAFNVQDWSRVYAAKISIMTRSLTDIANNNSLRRYILADAAPYEMTDTVSRQVFTTTFVINNLPK
jgi:type IV pilus assembly protein PilW